MIMTLFDASEGNARRHGLGLKGFKRTTGTLAGDFFAVKAVGGAITFGANNTVAQGDPPSENDTLIEGDILFAPFTQVHITAGTAYCYTL